MATKAVVKKKAEVEDLIVDLDKNTKLVEIEKQKIQGDKDAVEIKRNEIFNTNYYITYFFNSFINKNLFIFIIYVSM